MYRFPMGINSFHLPPFCGRFFKYFLVGFSSGTSRIAGFGEGTPQQVSREGQNRRIADFGTVVETCSKKLPDCHSLPTATFSENRNQLFYKRLRAGILPLTPYNTAKSKNDGLSGKNFSGGSVFPDNKAFWKLCFARCLIENGKFPCSHTSTDTFPICQKWAQKKQQIFFGFTASCAAAGRRDIQFLCYRSNRNLNRLSISFVLM